jgi:hypothetical protein
MHEAILDEDAMRPTAEEVRIAALATEAAKWGLNIPVVLHRFVGWSGAMVTADVAKRLLLLHGEVRSQPGPDWTGAFPIPPALERFYQEIGPFNVTIEAYRNSFLPCLADLWQFQTGYRWDGLTGEPIESWPDD